MFGNGYGIKISQLTICDALKAKANRKKGYTYGFLLDIKVIERL